MMGLHDTDIAMIPTDDRTLIADLRKHLIRTDDALKMVIGERNRLAAALEAAGVNKNIIKNIIEGDSDGA